ncbi:MAG TPA: thioredoxin [Bacteroidales bacterium]|jgi:thioredoxin 1|nr:thioredoxin [Bacteroidales bacterium]
MNTVMTVTGVLILAFAVLYLVARSKMKNIPVIEDNDDIIKLTDKNFDHQTKNKVVLVDFRADWCMPCRMMAPVLNDLAGDLNGNAYVGKVDVEQNRGLARKHNIRNIPTMVLFKNGKEVNRFVGVKTKDFLKSQIQKVA